MIALFVLGFLLMVAGPFMQGLTGSDKPNAYVFAPIMLAASIPLLSGWGLSLNPRLIAQAILICGALCLGAWYLGGLFAPRVLSSAAPIGTAIAGALICAAANLMRARKA